MRGMKRLFSILVILISAVLPAAAADFSSGLSLGFENNGAGSLAAVPGSELRIIGGRGIGAAKIDLEYLGGNYRGYSSSAPAGNGAFLLSAFTLLQASIMYGDLTFYAGPGTTLMFTPGEATVAHAVFVNDSEILFLIGTSYTFFPVQIFLELEADMPFASIFSGFASPRVRFGASFMAH